METVSVVIPTYNREAFLPDAIDSVLSQTLRPYEIIVVDDGSTDATSKVLEKYSNEITIIRQENSGVSVARNAGIKIASGSLVAFLDSDDIWLPKKLARELECFESDPALALVHSDVFLLKDGVRTRPRSGREKFSGNCYSEFFFESPAFPILSTVMVRASSIARVGLFDEHLRTSEDIDFWLRIARFYPFKFINESLILRRIHGQNLTCDMSKFFVTDLRVYEKAAQEDPKVMRLVGRATYLNRLGRIAYLAGYWIYREGDDSSARAFLYKSIHYATWSARTWILLFWTFVPKPMRIPLLKLRDSISSKGSSGFSVGRK